MPTETWDREVRDPLRAFTRKDVRTGPFLKRFLPWNVWKSETTVEALAARYEKELTPLRLDRRCPSGRSSSSSPPTWPTA